MAWNAEEIASAAGALRRRHPSTDPRLLSDGQLAELVATVVPGRSAEDVDAAAVELVRGFWQWDQD